ncbi:MAG: SEC-C metal-binding domain-containing protein [Actinomycetota bacterium]
MRVEDGWVSLLAVTDGAVLTHVLTAEERELGVLTADGDLDVWGRLADSGLRLDGGGEVRARWVLGRDPLPCGASMGLAGPQGWLDDFHADQVLALRLRGGTLTVSALDGLPTPEDSDRERSAQLCRRVTEVAASALADYLAEEPGSGPSAFLEDAVSQALYHHPGLLDEPLPPLSTVLRESGLEVRGGLVAMPGLPPDREVDDLDDVEIQALVATHSLLPGLRDHRIPDGERMRFLLTALRIPVVAERLADAVELGALPPDVVLALLEAARDDERVGALLLAARSAEGRGDYEAAERLVTEAAEHGPTCMPAVLDAAQYAAARGDALRADGLLKRAGVPAEDPVRQALRPLLTLPEGTVSRNRPCPCGSRRKYKACCLPRLAHPLPTRARLAYARLVVHAQRPRLFENAGRFVSKMRREALDLAIDMAVFEAGVIEDYLECRGHLLATDERQLLESWAGTPLSAYEVVSVEPGRSVTLRRLPSGDPVVLHDRAFSGDVRPLDVVQARLLWDGEKLAVLATALRVHRFRRAALVDVLDGGYDPEELAAFWGPQLPPRLQNREGHEVVLCQATYRSNAEDAWDRLREHLRQDDDDDRLLMVSDLAGDEVLVQGSVRRAGSQWTLETNSVERLRGLQRLFCAAVPDAVLVSESTRPVNDILGNADAVSTRPAAESGLVDLSPEEEVRLLEEHMARYEEAWLDMELPGLGGRTPRVAVAEGGRPLTELQAMLDDMAWMRREHAGPGGMDPDRLRHLLGIARE